MQVCFAQAAEDRQLSFLSPAKINVFFRVLGKREDGFHEISSLYQAIDLCDTLTLSASSHDIFTCSDPSLPMQEDNLVIKALRLFRKKTGFLRPCALHLDKKIPMMAGLGGGSSNAATTLAALNTFSGLNLATQTLASWGAELGSDVPFFFFSGAALASGRGEILVDTEPFLQKPLWIVKPKEGLATPHVYKICKPSAVEREGMFYNDLEEPAFTLLPSLRVLKESLLTFGFKTVLLCGSGTSFFCTDPKEPCNEKILRERFPGMMIFAAKPFQRKQSGWYE